MFTTLQSDRRFPALHRERELYKKDFDEVDVSKNGSVQRTEMIAFAKKKGKVDQVTQLFD